MEQNAQFINSLKEKIPLLGCSNYIPLGVLFDASGSESRLMSNGQTRYENGISCLLDCLDDLQRNETMAENVHLFLSVFGNGQVTPVVTGDALYEISREALEKKLRAIRCQGNTNMGEATCKALGELQAAKVAVGERGLNYSQPTLMIVSDGEANDSMDEAMRQLDNMQENEKLVLMPVGIGDPGKAFPVFSRMLERDHAETPVISTPEEFRSVFRLLGKTVRAIERGEFVITPYQEFGKRRNIQQAGGVRE